MELYFQEHQVPRDAPPRRSSSHHVVLLQLASAISNLSATRHANTATRDRIAARIDSLFSQLSASEVNITGTPPTSQMAIASLPVVNVQSEDGEAEKDCPICTETFEHMEPATKLPCGHYFHRDCVVPWLKMHSTCPSCRHELPTDDFEYEAQKRHRQRQTAVNQLQNFMYN